MTDKFTLKKANDLEVILNPFGDSALESHLHAPQAQVSEMISQINARHYYDQFFKGKKDLVFIDFGANLGLVSIYASPSCRRILAFEPEPKTFAMLCRMVQPYPVIECIPVALSSVNAEASLAVDNQDFSCNTIINPKQGQPLVRVKAKTLLKILEDYAVDYVDVCKVDVEGSEMESLDLNTLRTAPVNSWYIEVHKTPSQTREISLEVMLSQLRAAGYSCTTPRPNAIIAVS